MGFKNWLKEIFSPEVINNKEETEYEGLFEEIDPQKERASRRWINLRFTIPLSNKEEFDKCLKIIKEGTNWKISETFDELKKEGLTHFQVGGNFSVKGFLRIRTNLLSTDKRLAHLVKPTQPTPSLALGIGGEKATWFIEQEQVSYYTEDNKEYFRAYNLIVIHSFLKISFFLERLQELNEKDKELTKEVLGDYLEDIRLSHTPDGFVVFN